MDKLKFIGRGCAFNPKEGNTSAYHIIDDHLILIDCGEGIFERIMDINLLKDINKVDILITHLHSDHAGSLSSLIYYLYYVKKIIATITFPAKSNFDSFFIEQGNIEGIHYKLNTTSKFIKDIEIIPNHTSHYELFRDVQTGEVISNPSEAITPVINAFNSYGYYLKSPNKTIYYSGDSNEFNIDLSKVDLVYQDCSIVDIDPFPHLTFNKLCKAVRNEDRHKVYLMHIDSDDIFTLAHKNGFNVVSLAYKPSLYILKTIRVTEKTEDMLRKEWEIRNIKYPKTKVSYENYLKFLESWNDRYFEFSSEDNCYFKDLDTAKHYAETNMADMNDGGIYNYVAILRTDLERTYAMTNYDEAYLFKFNYSDDCYEPVEFTDTKEGKFIIDKLGVNSLFN